MKQNQGTTVETDVLVIGGGIAALFAAIKAKEAGPSLKVILADKCHAGVGGATAFGAGEFPFWTPGDDLENFAKETITEHSEYLIDQDYAMVAIQDTYQAFLDLVKYGVQFQRDSRGRVLRHPTLTSKFGCTTPYKGGLQLPLRMRAECKRLGVQVMDSMFVADLLVSDGRCAGAVGFDLVTGEFHVFKSKATVLAAGSVFFGRPQMGSAGATGDGPAMGFRAGLPIRSAEQLWASHGPAFYPSGSLHVTFGNAGYLRNAKGERFMERYNPKFMESARRWEVARAILLEWKEGRGPCYLDCSHLPSETIEVIKTSLPLFAAALKASGQDLAKDKIEWVPYALSLLHTGGTRIKNADGEVDMAGLWAVGGAGDFCGGADQTAVAGLPGSAVQGRRGGRRAAEFAAGAAAPKVDAAQVERLRKMVFAPMEPANKGADPYITRRDLTARFVRYVNLIKDEAMLKQGLIEIGKLQEQFRGGLAKDFHHLKTVHETRNMLQLAEVCAKSALMRTETRECHYRSDFPKRDDKNWLKWVEARLVKGKVEIGTEDIPVEKWKYSPRG